jgi:hypothetical protein
MWTTDYGERHLGDYDGHKLPGEYNDCDWPDSVYVYEYPVPFKYTEGKFNRSARKHFNVTLPVKALCFADQTMCAGATIPGPAFCRQSAMPRYNGR